jgi:hypothetical protein
MLGKTTSHSEYEEVLPKYTQNNVIAGCHTHGGPMLQSHQINVCHRDHQVKINQGLSGGSGGRTTIHIPQLIAPPISDTANSKANVKAAGGTLLNAHNNYKQTCGDGGHYCTTGDGDETPQEGGSKKTKKKHHKKRKQNRKTRKINKKTKKNRNSNKNRKIKGILKKTKNSKNSKNFNKNKKSRKTKKVRFHK